MITSVICCDRCGREVITADASLLGRRVGERGERKVLDLCFECNIALARWLEEKPRR